MSYFIAVFIVCYNQKTVTMGHLPSQNNNCEVQTDPRIFKTMEECNTGMKKYFAFKSCTEIKQTNF